MRVPRERAGDFRATVAANKTGVNRLRELIDKFGMDVFKENIQYLVAYVEYRARVEIRKMRNGTYRYHDFLDNDGITDEPMKIEVEVIIEDDQITFNFSDSAKQSAGPLNMTFAQTASTVYLAMKAVTDVTIPINSGFYKPIRIIAPEGSIVNAAPPAAVAGSNEVCARTFDVLMGALSEVVPERKLASCYSSANYVLISGAHPETGETYICFMFPAGGWGARSCKDGVNAFYVLPSNAPNSPVEAHEIRYPVLFERRELRQDSGGPGEYRGGLGTREDIKILADRATLTLLGDRTKFSPPGLFGGKPGKPGVVRLLRGGKQRAISRLGWKVTDFRLKRNDIVSVRTAGGGGFGEPIKRDPDLIKKDTVNGYVSKKSALRDYVREVRLK
jgi:N-methylhydantoinase B